VTHSAAPTGPEPSGTVLDRIETGTLRTLGSVSTTEEDLETSVADDAIDALTADDTGGHDGPSTAELDALDESLVESIEDYASGDGDLDGADNGAEPEGDEEAADVDEIVADTDTSDTDPSDTDPSDDTDISDELVADDEDSSDVLAAENDSDESAEAAELFVEDEYDDDYVDDDHTFEVPKIVAATTTLDTDADTDTDTDKTDDADAGVDDSAELAEAKDGDSDAPGVSPNIIEELRRADIDGPVVDAAPQDDTTSGRRRPKKAVDYDPAPVPVPLKVPRILGRKPRVRKVTRVVRHVDPWSVFKIALLANFVLYVIVLVAGVLLWNVAYATGTVENVERFFESFGWQSFEFNGGELYHAAWIAGLFAVIGFTGLWVLLATLFNLITDVVGGARFTVLEEEVVESRTSPMRRFVVRRPEPEIPAVLSDASGPLIREAIIDDTGDIKR
jgi:hypothetical protein